MSGEKTRKLHTLTKLFQAMRSRTIWWQDCKTTYLRKLESELWKLAKANYSFALGVY